MKISTTAGIAMLAAAAIAIAIGIAFHLPSRSAIDPQSAGSIGSPSQVTQPGMPHASASPTSPQDPAAASSAELARLTIQGLSATDPSLREQAVSQLLPALAARDAVAAARVADLFLDSELRPRVLSAVARAWADQNRSHALAWAQGLSDANEREAMLVEIYARIAQADPAEAVRLRLQFAEYTDDDAELTNLAQRWAESDLNAVLGWTDSLPPGTQRDQLTARAAFIQAQSNAADAAQRVMDRIPRGEAQSEALISVVHQWAATDFDAASAWVARIPERLLRERAEQELEAAKRARP